MVGYTKTIHEAGSNGIVAIIWAEECHWKTRDKSTVGKRWYDMSDKSKTIAERVMNFADQDNDKRCFTGRTIVEKCSVRVYNECV